MFHTIEAEAARADAASLRSGPLELLEALNARFPDDLYRFDIAGGRFAVAGEPELCRQMTAALCGGGAPGGHAPDLRIVLWSGGPSPIAATPAHWRVRERWEAGQATRGGAADSSIYFDPHGGVVTLYDAARRTAGMWFAEPSRLAQWIVAAPFLRLFDAWFVTRDKLMCHGAAVEYRGAAALIVGPGGAGKSTFAIQAMGHGFGYIGDDYVLLEKSAGHPRVAAVYKSGKLFPSDVAAGLPEGVGRAKSDYSGDKCLLELDENRLISGAPIAAVIAPQLGADNAPQLERLTPAAALRILMPTALQQLPGREQAKLAIAADLARVPCYRLSLATDHARNIAVMKTLLSRPDSSVARP